MKSDEVKLITMESRCSFCTERFEKTILKITKNYGYLLPCEVELFNTKLKCDCGKIYFYKDLEKLINITEEQKEAAKERLEQYKNNFCLLCMKNLIHDDMKKIKIRKEDPMIKTILFAINVIVNILKILMTLMMKIILRKIMMIKRMIMKLKS